MRKRPLIKIIPSLLFIGIHVKGCAMIDESSPTLQDSWLVEVNSTDVGYFRAILYFESTDTSFEAHSRKNAVKDIVGPFKGWIAKMTSSSFEKGAVLHIKKGKMEAIEDGTKLKGVFISALGSFLFEATLTGNEFDGTLTKKGKVKGKIKGIKKEFQKPIDNYSELINEALTKTEKYIFNRSYLEKKAYKKFQKKISKFAEKAQDDAEIIFAFFYYKGDLNFSHYFLYNRLPENSSLELDSNDEDKEEKLTVEDKGKSTFYLKIPSFSIEPKAIDEAFGQIRKANPRHLIIDLRDNTGGTIAGMKVASNLADSAYFGGIFLTQKWFNKYSTPPSIDKYETFPVLSEANLDLLWDGIHNEDGLCLKVTAKEIYRGKVYILVNGVTASTCEPLVYGLKQYGIAEIIGEKTAGSMLNGEMFSLKENWALTLPTADYYTSDGFRIDQNGIVPNYSIDEKTALDYVLNNLID